MDALPPTDPQFSKTVNDVFENIQARRSAIVKALTTDIRSFSSRCDPVKDHLCLYGHHDGNWEVTKPPLMVPSEFPEPTLGINFARDYMKQDEWVAMVADYSDAWLYSVAYYIGYRYSFNRAERQNLFDMINELPTISEVIRDTTGKQPEGSSNSSNPKTVSDPEAKQSKEGICGTACGGCEIPTRCPFWICCDICATWYHGRCVNISPAMAKYIKQYICEPCNKKRERTHDNTLHIQ